MGADKSAMGTVNRPLRLWLIAYKQFAHPLEPEVFTSLSLSGRIVALSLARLNDAH